MSRPLAPAVLLAALSLLAGCGADQSTTPSDGAQPPGPDGGAADGGTSGGQPSPTELFSDAIRTVVLEVDYAPGAEPFTGATATGRDTWDLFGENAARLFEGGAKELRFPRTLDEMEALPEAPAPELDGAALLALAEAHRDQLSGGDTATFYALWVPSYYVDQEGARREDVLGVSLGDTGVIAMFKPVIDGSSLTEVVRRFVEQTTLIHEFGHAVGLVNRGLPMASPHHDEAHGAHCINQDCVMFYAIEGVADMVSFVQGAIQGDTDLFGPECLADAAAAR